MTTGMAEQLAALKRIAAFSAAVRGHELGEWRTGDHVAVANCLQCGARLRVYFPAVQPEMDGAALGDESCLHGIARAA